MPTPSPDDFDLNALKRAVMGNAGGSSTPSFNAPRFNLRWLWALPVLWLLLTFARSFVLVGAGERAVIFNRFSGTQPGQKSEGLHFIIPWVQSATIYDVKTQIYNMSDASSEANAQAGDKKDAVRALTADGLPVDLEMSISYHIDPNRVSELHRLIGPDFENKIVRPQARSHMRMVVARYPVIDVYGPKRARIIQEINSRLRTLFAQNSIVLDDALLRAVTFSTEFQQTIEQKQAAQQDVQRMTFVVQQADKERRRKIIEAEGEAESIRLKARALAQNPQLVQYEYVKNLPTNVRTVVTDGRTIVSLGEALNNAGVVASSEGAAPATAPPTDTSTDTSSGAATSDTANGGR